MLLALCRRKHTRETRLVTKKPPRDGGTWSLLWRERTQKVNRMFLSAFHRPNFKRRNLPESANFETYGERQNESSKWPRSESRVRSRDALTSV